MYSGRLPTSEIVIHIRGLIQPWSASAIVCRRFNLNLRLLACKNATKAMEQMVDVTGIVSKDEIVCTICAALIEFSWLVKIRVSSPSLSLRPTSKFV
jgi:hypothetical protein